MRTAKRFRFYYVRKRTTIKMAVEQLNDYLVRPNRQISVRKSVDNRRLFIGAIMKNKAKGEIQKALECHVDELNDIIMYRPYSPNQQAQNRGYVFSEFATRRGTAMARRLSKFRRKIVDKLTFIVVHRLS
ncbi:hypothetical protein ILUMI_03868 [Ignelater luminosus]|uniref:Uncharacterized protein n=1 Tax=Ignelater luminosus TaxID=2038154 RepID=A0A8K0DDP0_IGNLU|nr:hypothetical protein ILUMI_03868 [Ignelater luminosus]